MKKLIALVAILGLIGLQGAFAQTRSIKGTVTSKEDGMGLPGVNVTVKGTTIGTATDMDGNFNLNVSSDATILVISSIGYQTLEMPVQDVITVALESESKKIDEVMVVAFGTTKKSSFTGSASTVNTAKIDSRPITNITQALEGAASGVQFTAASGQPGSEQAIRIRGFGSINASNDPLYILDGVPYPGTLSSINPSDIENVTILKDAASTALYGSKAANGVIIVTTKKGKKGTSVFQVKASQGYSVRGIKEYDRVGVADYYTLMWEADRNNKLYNATVLPTEAVANLAATNGLITNLKFNILDVPNNEIVVDGVFNPNAKVKSLVAEDLNWLDNIQRTGKRSEYSVMYSGGQENTDYMYSMGYTKDDGYIINSDLERFTGRINVNSRIKKWLKTGLNVSGTKTKSNYQVSDDADNSSSYNNPFNFTRGMGPIYPVYAHDLTTTEGDYYLGLEGERLYDYGQVGTNRASGASTGRHVVAETKWNKNVINRNVMNSRAYAEFTFMEGLKLTTNFGMDLNNYYLSKYENSKVGDGAPAGRASKTNSLTTIYNLQQLLEYSKNYNKHNFTILAGHESYQYNYAYVYGMKNTETATNNFELINFTTVSSLDSYARDYATEGYLSRLEYNFDNKYFLSGSVRADGTSRFQKDNRWGKFWSVGGAWRLDQEDFIKNIKAIDQLKLRVSYGELGNDNIGTYYGYQAVYNLGNNNAGQAGYLQGYIGNDNVQWETNKSLDFGIEFGVLNMIRGNVDIYKRMSDNLLFDVPLPISSGYVYQTQNIGSMENRGIELSLAIDPIKTREFKWTVDVNLSTVKNEITKLPQEELIVGTKKLMKGHSLYEFWLRECKGVDPTDGIALFAGDMSQYSVQTAKNYRIIGSDTLATNQNYAKYHYAGSAIPDLTGSIANSVSYKNFELSVLITFQVGGKVYDATYANIMSSGTYGGALHKDILDRWQKPGDITDIPRMDAGKTATFNASSDRWLVDASYLNIRNINLSYNLPQSWLTKIDLASCKVFFGAENIAMFTKRAGMNVQQNFSGVTSNVYVPARGFTAGINFTF
ncbi:SusC/RagA family TonB-linked outer membrane protein [Williamwhitmania taraxaci]|uniref:TonB-linked outer membrane protein, SusC/RagA family n=1 Tax=Williamwhitmania taraxaci TaxID=1640674 RepID=A0A1G6S6H8_9BACT|nr:TonB-dependent receptor [Williamwhitmania taraxaci]SDD12439.1 TonB-linked outer membrane protein, SusC/RagA family [Williamwhitmania taraxaci]